MTRARQLTLVRSALRTVPALTLTLAFALGAPSAGVAQQDAETAVRPEGARWQSSHTITVGGETVAYDAVIASTILERADGTPGGELFYTAYFRTNGAPSAERPLVFAYNGGPDRLLSGCTWGSWDRGGWSPRTWARRERLRIRWRTTPTRSWTRRTS